jgi:hypothetical protein
MGEADRTEKHALDEPEWRVFAAVMTSPLTTVRALGSGVTLDASEARFMYL